MLCPHMDLAPRVPVCDSFMPTFRIHMLTIPQEILVCNPKRDFKPVSMSHHLQGGIDHNHPEFVFRRDAHYSFPICRIYRVRTFDQFKRAFNNKFNTHSTQKMLFSKILFFFKIYFCDYRLIYKICQQLFASKLIYRGSADSCRKKMKCYFYSRKIRIESCRNCEQVNMWNIHPGFEIIEALNC